MPLDWVIPLLTLTAMEIVLGIDNVVFLAIVVGKLPKHQQKVARQVGLGLALGMRILLLLGIKWIMGLTEPLFELPSLGFMEKPEAREISARDLILIVGGLFLVGKSTFEIHERLEGPEEKPMAHAASVFGMAILQIIMLDLIFSLDSVITAVGMARDIWVMIVAMMIAVGVMLVFAGKIGDFVHRHPTMKILALSFLILIGVMLLAEGFAQHIDRGYIYFAMAFALVVEIVNLRVRGQEKPLELKGPEAPSEV